MVNLFEGPRYPSYCCWVAKNISIGTYINIVGILCKIKCI
jgi:hypothetical protein